MPETTARDAKLIQYLNEAYGKEKQLVTTLQAQIKLAGARPAIQKRLKEHLKETRDQAKGLERRIKQLGGKADASGIPGPDVVGKAVAGAANQALAAAKAPVQALRGTSQADNLLRNMRDAFWNEAEEIAHYNVIEALAEQLGDRDTAKLAREFRRQEERVQTFLEKQLKALVRDVIKEEVPKEERAPAAATSSRSSGGTRSGGTRSRSTASKSTTAKSGTSRSGSSRAKASGSSSRAKASASSSRSTRASSGTRKTPSRAKASTTSRRSGGGGSSSG